MQPPPPEEVQRAQLFDTQPGSIARGRNTAAGGPQGGGLDGARISLGSHAIWNELPVSVCSHPAATVAGVPGALPPQTAPAVTVEAHPAAQWCTTSLEWRCPASKQSHV